MKKINTFNMIEEIVTENKEVFKNDEVAICETYNNMIDSLHKDGELTDNQVNSFFLTKKEIKNLLKIVKGL